MKKFEVGKTYRTVLATDRNCVIECTVTERTEKTVTIKDELTGEVKKCKIIAKLSEYNGAESIYPLGKYSLCPTLKAC